MNGHPALMTARDVADRLALDLKTVRRHTRRGDWDAFAINLGSQARPVWRYDPARLEKWLDGRRLDRSTR